MDDVLRDLERSGYLDDRRVAGQFARSRLARHGIGQNRIRHELRRRGVGRATAEKGVKAALADVAEVEVLDALARRHFERQAGAPAARLRRVWALLLRRGFPAALVHERLRALWPRSSEALAGLEEAESSPDD